VTKLLAEKGVLTGEEVLERVKKLKSESSVHLDRRGHLASPVILPHRGLLRWLDIHICLMYVGCSKHPTHSPCQGDARETQPLVSCCPTPSFIPLDVDARMFCRGSDSRTTNLRTCPGSGEVSATEAKDHIV
jgi:hypothetical protein